MTRDSWMLTNAVGLTTAIISQLCVQSLSNLIAIIVIIIANNDNRHMPPSTCQVLSKTLHCLLNTIFLFNFHNSPFLRKLKQDEVVKQLVPAAMETPGFEATYLPGSPYSKPIIIQSYIMKSIVLYLMESKMPLIALVKFRCAYHRQPQYCDIILTIFVLRQGFSGTHAVCRPD